MMNTTMSELTYRKGSGADKDQLKALGIIAYGQYAKVLTPDNWEILNNGLHNEERLLDLIDRSVIYVCCDEDRIVGTAYFIPSGNPTPLFKTEWSYIRMVGVHPEYEGRGIAKALTSMCIGQARQTGEHTIALHTSEFMDAARHIYERLGFTVLSEIEPIFGKRYWLYTLEI